MRLKITCLAGIAALALALLVSLAPATHASTSSLALNCTQDYTVQVGDSISLIAQKYYNKAEFYPAIINATNTASQESAKYTPITDSGSIEAGQILCIPGDEDLETLQANFQAGPAPTQPQTPPAQGAGPTPPAPLPSFTDQSIAFSQDSVVTRQPFQLTLTARVPGTIRYTTNGSLPDANSTLYQNPLTIDKNTILRAQVFDNAGQPAGGLHTKTYLLVDYEQTIPVMSVVADWNDINTLHDAARERGKEWERPINLEYFAPGGQVHFNLPAGIRIHGNFSRLFNPKKSYRIYFSKSYGGPGNLDYPLFEGSPVTRFDKLVLRAGFQDTFTHRGIPDRSNRHETATYISDQVARDLHLSMGQLAPHGTWVLLYINGEFWGLYNLTERPDIQFLRSYSDKNSDWDVIVKESGWDELGQWYSHEEVREGGYGAWLENQDWIGNADFSNPGNLGVWEWRIDKENVFTYMFLQAYIQNTDWPSANWIVYRRNDPAAAGNEAKWRMMVWDAEDSFGTIGGAFKPDENTVVRVHSPHDSITRILEKPFIRSCGLKHEFAQRSLELLGVENPYGKPPEQIGQLSKERVRAEIIKNYETIRPFMPMEIQRWAPDLNMDLFERNIQNMLLFVDQREEVIIHHLDILRYQTFTECQ